MKPLSFTVTTNDPDSLSHAIGDASEKMLTDLTPVDHGALAFGLLYLYNTLKTHEAMGDTNEKTATGIAMCEMIFNFAQVEIPRHVTLTPIDENESN